LGGQDRLRASEWHDAGLEHGLSAGNLQGTQRPVEEFRPGSGTSGEGLPGGPPAVNMRRLRGALDEETNQVIGIQVDHAGRRTSAASRSSYTSLRYCCAWPGVRRASACRRRRASRGDRGSFEVEGPDAGTGRSSTTASPFRMRMSSPAIARSNHRPKPLTASSRLNVFMCLSLPGWRGEGKVLSQSPPPPARQSCPHRLVGLRALTYVSGDVGLDSMYGGRTGARDGKRRPGVQ